MQEAIQKLPPNVCNQVLDYLSKNPEEQGQMQTAAERTARAQRELSYELDSAVRALHAVHEAEKVMLLANDALQPTPAPERLIFGTEQIDPLRVLAGPIQAHEDKVARARNHALTRANSSPYVYVAKLFFLRTSPVYQTSEGKDMTLDSVLVKWGGIVSGVRTVQRIELLQTRLMHCFCV